MMIFNFANEDEKMPVEFTEPFAFFLLQTKEQKRQSNWNYESLLYVAEQ